MSRLSWRGLAAAALLAAGLASAHSRWPPRYDPHLWGLADYGEALRHGVHDPELDPSYVLPLAGLAASGMLYHSGPEERRLWPAALVIGQAALCAAAAALAGSGSAAAAAVGLLALTPEAWVRADKHSVYSLFVLLAAAALAWRARSPTRARSALAACAIGTGLLYRSPLAFLPPLLLIADWRASGRRFPPRGAWVLAVAPYLFLVPWWLMNRSVHGETVVFERGEAHSNLVAGALGLTSSVEGDWRVLPGAPSGREGLDGLLVWAAGETARHPLRAGLAVARRIGYVAGLQPILVLLAVAGFWLGRRRPELRALAGLAAYFVGVHCLLAVHPRYSAPLWPVLAALAAPLLDVRRGVVPPPERERRRVDALAGLALGAGLVVALAAAAAACLAVGRYALLARARAPAGAAALDDALAAAPRDSWLLARRGRQRLEAGDAAGAAQDLSAAAGLAPESGAALDLAAARLAAGDPDSVLAVPLDIERKPRAELRLRALRAGAYLGRGDPGAARAELRLAQVLHGRTAGTVHGVGAARESSAREALAASAAGAFAGEVQDSIRGLPPRRRLEVARLVVETSPEDPGAWAERAAAALEAGLAGEADESLARAGRLGSGTEPLRRAGQRSVDRSGCAAALPLLERLSRLRPRDGRLLADRALCERLAGRTEDAVAHLREATRLEPGYLPSYLTLGAVHMERGETSAAGEVYDRALAQAGPGADPGMLRLIRRSRRELP